MGMCYSGMEVNRSLFERMSNGFWKKKFLGIIGTPQGLSCCVSLNEICENLSDCPNGSYACLSIVGINSSRCIRDVKEVCTGGIPINPVTTCSRDTDCSPGWCDLETQNCCNVDPKSSELPMCPDRLTPLYAQQKCIDVEKDMVYSGTSEQKGGLCYKGYSCPPKIKRGSDEFYGVEIFETNISCSTERRVSRQYSFMFCDNQTGHLWFMGQYNVNGDEVTRHWTHCQKNKDCGEGHVCVKEDLGRFRCYDDPTIEVNYNWIVVRLLAMFFVPVFFLIGIIVLNVKYLD
ncbi:hypothetical protein B9Z55_014490 [Caenorhabditis nigoni]|uniref:Domain of unknown function DX domain-containing protein n=3 Tax=Caenorhabditis nigoni TaxID=1611254 RepID=A0A2G5U6M3_9PELO|nr:hypothetical protein B9Z55_014490 [Caenorhabditis nigoni]